MKRQFSPLNAGLIGAALAGVVAVLLGSIPVAGQSPRPVPGKDPVAMLEEQIQRRQVKLDYQKNELGLLPSLLKHLDVNVDSQMLVFSKTSFHADLIGPTKPRAVYFNDDVFVGVAQRGDIELAALDPAAGLVFYSLEATPAQEPRFVRRDAVCATCHGLIGSGSLLTQSVFPDPDGNALFLPGLTPPPPDHTTPIEQRWGGWYVTGTHGSQHHMGNAVVPDPYSSSDLQQEGTQNLTTLKTKVDLSRYMAQTSDLIALMTFEHQLRMVNLIARISRQAREVEKTGNADGAATDGLKAGIEEMLQYMLFVEEAPLREPIRGVSSFAATFPARGPRDSDGRSLRDFDLQTRVFRYPLSYMIYSASFETIPDSVKAQLYKRLYDILTNRDTSSPFARVSTVDRKAIFEILRATKPNLPDYWREDHP
jgi:hypothetical protein